jgi:predicted membrane-bound spermidine synthase
MVSSAESTPKSARLRLLAAAFLSGAAVMILELTAARAMAPVFGTSIFTWTNVLGTVLAALALGYGIGGRLADRRPDPVLLGWWLLVAAAVTVPLPFLTKPLGEGLLPAPVPLDRFEGSPVEVWGSLVTVAVLFAPPIVLMGMVCPFVTRCLADTGLESARAAGLTLCISTLGSLIGTYLPAHLLLEWVGVRMTIWTSTGCLVLSSFLLLRTRRTIETGGQ